MCSVQLITLLLVFQRQSNTMIIGSWHFLILILVNSLKIIIVMSILVDKYFLQLIVLVIIFLLF